MFLLFTRPGVLSACAKEVLKLTRAGREHAIPHIYIFFVEAVLVAGLDGARTLALSYGTLRGVLSDTS